jgi:hypothetical protein
MTLKQVRNIKYIVEGVWDGEFEKFGFHDTRAFFGSGLRIVGDDVYLVPSAALTDRIFVAAFAAHYVAANSLPLLLAK